MSERKVLAMSHASKAGPEAELVPLLLSIAKSTRALMGLKLAEHDFHNGQDELLLALEKNTLFSVSDIAEQLSVRPSTISKMLDRVIAKGLAERVGSTTDARKTMVQITPAGLEARSELMQLREEIEVQLRGSLTIDDEVSLRSLESLATVLKQRLSRLR